MNTPIIHETEAIPALAPGIAQKINALHDTAQRLENDSKQKLHDAVCAAWRAGKLLLEAKASIVRHGGRGAWIPWVQTMFKGGIRTAQRYMKLARELPDFTSAASDAISLRQLYFRLGIATEPKQARAAQTCSRMKLPAHISLANRLLRVLRTSQKNIHPQDLAALYKQLRAIVEPVMAEKSDTP